MCFSGSRGVVGAVVLGSLLNAFPARAERCTELPVMLIVQDKSNSMWGYPNASCTTANPCDSKWEIASTVVPDVAAEFTGGFRYAMSLYPGDGASSNSCSLTNLQQLNIGATAEDIQTAFMDATPAGATPTADALQQARQYLVANNVAAPGYVLLVTDGLPNCNIALDPNASTCSCTVPKTGSPLTCPTKRCLDDVGTRQSAADLRAAGYTVFVVGFGSEVTANNNVAVLNAVAAAGGTGSAYIADNATGLYNQLRTIINGVNNCCQDACALGDVECAPSETARNVCQLGAEGCNVWATQPCGNGSVCNATTEMCTTCNSTCTAGAQQCVNDGTQRTCVADSRGCTSWQNQACVPGTTCTGNSCSSCTNTCTAGATRCDGNGTQTCVVNAQGCTGWSATNACLGGSVCNNGACTLCNGTCVAGARECTDVSAARLCVADAQGCTSWTAQTCNVGETCGGGECNSCNACTGGETRCSGNLPQTCVTDDLAGCTAWTTGTACGVNQVCGNGGCQDCADICDTGASRCSNNGVETCVSSPGECNRWEPKTACAPTEACVNSACCTNTCTAGATQCNGAGEVQVCVTQTSGCTGWSSQTLCAAGEACFDATCRVTCELTGEGDTNCPEGSECIILTDTAGYCSPVDPGTGGTSSSSGFMGTRMDAGPQGGVGGGEEEEELKANACGCETSSPDGAPVALVGVAAALSLVIRRRKRL